MFLMCTLSYHRHQIGSMYQPLATLVMKQRFCAVCRDSFFEFVIWLDNFVGHLISWQGNLMPSPAAIRMFDYQSADVLTMLF